MLTKNDIVNSLKKLGLTKGDVVLLHSALSSLGKVDGGAKVVVEAFLDVLGSEGTLVVPIFGALGIITDTVKNWPGAVQSKHPNASVAAIGSDAEKICKDHWKADTAHGADTPYTRIAECDGYICLLGVDQDRNTTLHTVEALLELPYLRDVTSTVETPEGPVEKTWKYFPGPHRDFIGLEKDLQKTGKMKIGKIGKSVTRLMKSSDLIDICMEIGKSKPDFALCDNPQCMDCKLQKGKLRQANFKAESFTVASSSVLAGRYIPEMIENLTVAGIKHIELDYIQGQPIDRIDVDTLKKHTTQLREADIEITALRSNSYGPNNFKLLEKAKELGIPRIIIPLHAQVEDLITEAESRNISVSFSNNNISSQEASNILLELNNKDLKTNFAFNPANFASIGENPFLSSFKTKLKKFMDQIDICDRTFDGIDTVLAGGNAEINEMISILRCSEFSGFMVLASSNRSAGTLLETTDRFLKILNSI